MINLVKNKYLWLTGLCFWAFMQCAQAELTIAITEGNQSAYKMAVVPFAPPQGDTLSLDIAEIINSDLASSGYFKLLQKDQMLSYPSAPDQVKFRNWSALGQDYLVIGSVNKDNNLYHVQMSLFDIYKKQQLKGLRVTVAEGSLRMAAHRISDEIYKIITGNSGIFSTRIAYVTKQIINPKRAIYQLNVADSDGANPISIVRSKQPIMSPSWSPDGEKIAYVSFENRVSEVFIQTLASGQRRSVAKFKGINGSPAWSPDGGRLALTLSKEGNSDIYVLNLAGSSLRKLTDSVAIDTEASWSPDGQSILFTSDRGRRPQLYRMSSNGGPAERVTFQGDYNASGSYSADGKSIVMVQGSGGSFRIALLDIASKKTTVLTNGPVDESPGFAPNGKVIIYARRQGQKEILSTVAINGATKQDLKNIQGIVREPSWAPMLLK